MVRPVRGGRAFYLLRSGCAWWVLSREYTPWQTVYYHLRRWRLAGRLRRVHNRLGEAVRGRRGATGTLA